MTDQSTHLYELYKSQIETGDPAQQEKALEDAEESHYMDAVLSATHYELLIRLYANLTGDHNIIQTNIV